MTLTKRNEYVGVIPYEQYVREYLFTNQLGKELKNTDNVLSDNNDLLVKAMFYQIYYHDTILNCRWTAEKLKQYLDGDWTNLPPRCGYTIIGDFIQPTQEKLVGTDIIPEPSEEQKAILQALKENNVVVDAVAGSGKTTTILHVALHNQDKQILSITYNARLRQETLQKANNLMLENITVHTYHSFGYAFVGEQCKTDVGLRQFVKSRNWNNKPQEYDILIIDESQDMTRLYYDFIKIVAAECNVKKVIILGDINQCIYNTLNGSDHRYLDFAESLWSHIPGSWIRKTLSTSYRITNTMADFVNKSLLDTTRINAPKTGPPVLWYEGNLFSENHQNQIVAMILDAIHKVGCGQVFILAPSVKKNTTTMNKYNNDAWENKPKKSSSPLVLLINKLSEIHKIPIYVKYDDDLRSDDELMADKLCINTFHGVKGLEREIVFLIGCDESYFEYYAKNLDKNICPNVIYVAATRAKRLLVCIKSEGKKHLPFIDVNELEKQVHPVRSLSKSGGRQATSSSVTPDIKPLRKNISVREFIKIVPNTIDCIMSEYINVEVLQKPGTKIKVQEKKKFTFDGKSIMELISNLIGISATVQYMLNCGKEHNSALTEEISNFLEQYEKRNNNKIYLSKFKSVIKSDKPSDIYYWANCFDCYNNGYTHRLAQVNNFNGWAVDAKGLQQNIQNTVNKYSPCSDDDKCFELRASKEIDAFNSIGGYMDLVCKDDIWEFKCVNDLSKEDELQLAVYAWLYNRSNNNYLYNMRTNELRSITIKKDFTPIINAIHCHTNHKRDIDDETFMASHGFEQIFKFCEECTKTLGYDRL